MLNNVSFAYPWVFAFLALIPLMVWYYYKWGKSRKPKILYSSVKNINRGRKNLREILKDLPFFLRIISLVFLIIAMARPQTFSSGENIYTEGIDISIVLDISSSMLAEDFRPNRIEAAKDVISDFIKGRVTDKIGLVIFSREAFTQCPLTIDYSVLLGLLKEVRTGIMEDGTAIGNALANGVNRLKDGKSKSKVIILLTDGENNAGEIDPLSAAQIAEKYKIRVYAIGVGTKGMAPYPFKTQFGTRYQNVPVNIDEDLLKKIAGLTGGKYFRAENKSKLRSIYDEIDKLEKSKVEITSFRNATELFYFWAFASLILLAGEFVLSRTYFKRLP